MGCWCLTDVGREGATIFFGSVFSRSSSVEENADFAIGDLARLRPRSDRALLLAEVVTTAPLPVLPVERAERSGGVGLAEVEFGLLARFAQARRVEGFFADLGGIAAGGRQADLHVLLATGVGARGVCRRFRSAKGGPDRNHHKRRKYLNCHRLSPYSGKDPGRWRRINFRPTNISVTFSHKRSSLSEIFIAAPAAFPGALRVRCP